MDVTDRHFRFLMRMLTRHTLLYTEMIVDKTIIHAPHRHSLLMFNECERPIALQVGGNDPHDMGQAMKHVLPYRYDEIDLNCGCPSSKVSGKGCFGAKLMETPEVVADVVQSIIREAHSEFAHSARAIRLSAD